MAKKDRESVSMKDAVKVFLKAQGLESEYKEKEVIGRWEELVGKPIALRTEKLIIKNSILYLKMNSSVMRDELFQRKSHIIEIINKEAGFVMIKDVYLK
jgi:predicted nucleic acid-binding Zn ribbon protein